MPHVKKNTDMTNIIGIKLAYYRKIDRKRSIKIIDDGESMNDTWNKWHKSFFKTKNHLIMQRLKVTDSEIYLSQLINYCKIRMIINDGKARSQFVQAK